MRREIILTVLILLIAGTSQGEISDKLTTDYNNKAQLKGFSLFGNIFGGFYSAIDYLFDNKINHMIYQLEAAADRILDHFTDDMNKIIDHFTEQMEALIDHAAEVAQKLIDHTIDEIKEKIIDETFAQLEQFETKLFNDITTILNKVDELIQKMSRAAEAVVKRVEDDLKTKLPHVVDPLDKCRIELNQRFPNKHFLTKPLNDFTLNELYEFRKCKLILGLDGKTKIESILLYYRDLEYMSADLRCANVAMQAYESEKYYLAEMAKAAFVLKTFYKDNFMPAPIKRETIKFLE